VQEPAQGRIAVQKGGFFVDVSPAFPKSLFGKQGNAIDAYFIGITRAIARQNPIREHHRLRQLGSLAGWQVA
jgi:hypothetical protein